MVEDITKACASFFSVPRGCRESPTKCQSTEISSPCIPKISSSNRFLSGISRVFLVYKCDMRTGPQAWPWQRNLYFFIKVSNIFTACRRSNLESIKCFRLAAVGNVDPPETYFQILNGASQKFKVSGSESLFPRPNPGLFIFYQPH